MMKKSVLLTLLFFLGITLFAADIPALRKKANGGDIAAQFQLAECYQKGDGVKKNRKTALKWYKQAAEKKHAEAAFRVGNYYLSGKKSFDEPDLSPLAHLPREVYEIIGIRNESYYNRDQEQIKARFIASLCRKEDDFKEACRYYDIAINENHAVAKYIAGVLSLQRYPHKEGEHTRMVDWNDISGYRKKYEYYEDYFIDAAKEKHPVAQYFLGICYSLFEPDKDTEAMGKLEKRLPAKRASALRDYLRSHKFTRKQNSTEANSCFIKSASLDFAPARHYLGMSHDLGVLNQNYSWAADYFKKASEQGYADSQYWLARYFRTGKSGVPADPQQAFKWFEAAAKQEHPDAQYELARCYEAGFGVEKDLEKAAHWFKKAADNRHIDAEYRYAVYCRDGIGREADLKVAREYFFRAAKGNHCDAQYQYALCLAYGKGGEKDLTEAAGWMLLAGEKDHPQALYRLANYCNTGSFDELDLQNINEIITRKVEEYRVHYEKIFILNQEYGQWELAAVWKAVEQWKKPWGYNYGHGVWPHDNDLKVIQTLRSPKYSLHLYARAAAANGNGRMAECGAAQYVYAVCLANGVEMDITPANAKPHILWRKEILIGKDPAHAEFWLEKAVRNKVDIARYELANKYLAGQDEARHMEAVKILRQASADCVPAGELLISCLITGKGISADPAEADRLGEKFFAKDPAFAVKMGDLYAASGMVKEAEKWYNKGVEKELPEAHFALALLHARNQAPDKAKAAFEQASQLDFIFAVKAAEYYLKEAKNPEAAESFIQIAIQSGNGKVLLALASCFTPAVHRYREIIIAAADAGNSEAEYIAAKIILADKSRSDEDLSKAVEYLKKAAGKKHHPAIYLLGKCYDEGLGVELNLTEAVKLFENAAQAGNGDAAYQLALCYATGNKGVKKDYKQAVMWLYRAACAGNADAAARLANYLAFGSLQDRDLYFVQEELAEVYGIYLSKRREDLKEVFNYNHRCDYNCQHTCDNKDCNECKNSCYNMLFSETERKKLQDADEKSRRRVLKEMSADKRVECIGNVTKLEILEHIELVHRFKISSPVSKLISGKFDEAEEHEKQQKTYCLGNDYRYIIGLYAAAAEAGSPYAQYILAMAYYRGVNDLAVTVKTDNENEMQYYPIPMISRDYTRAVHYFQLASDQGNYHAQYYLGLCYMYGRGVTKNPDKAIELFTKAADKGHKFAQYQLGLYYKEIKKFDMAFKYFSMAARQEHQRLGMPEELKNCYADAQYELAECYAHGRGTAKNQQELIFWYHKSALNGHKEAFKKLVAVYSDPAKIENKEAAVWYRREQKKVRGEITADEETDYIAWYIHAISYKYGVLEEQSDNNYRTCLDYAKNGGIVDAMFEMFQCWAKGIGGAKDPVKAMECLEMAGEHGHPQAMYYIAINTLLDLENNVDRFDAVEVDFLMPPEYKWAQWEKQDKAKQDEEKKDRSKEEIKDINKRWREEKIRQWREKQNEGWRKLAENRKFWENFKLAAQSGLVQAQYIYGYYLMYRKNVGEVDFVIRHKDQLEAAEWFYTAAKGGNDAAREEVAFAFAHDLISKKDKSKEPDFIWECLIYAYKQKEKRSDENIIQERRIGNVEADIDYARAECYIDGYGTARNVKMAGKCYVSAIEKGSPYARYKFAFFYLKGKFGMRKNMEQAENFFREVDANVIPDAAFQYGCIRLEKGLKIEKNLRKIKQDEREEAKRQIEEHYREAFSRFEAAARNGHVESMAYLGRCYEYGYGKPQNYFTAAEWYTNAAEAGHPQACYRLGLLYLDGKGVGKNRAEGIEYLKKAAKTGHKNAIEKLQELGESAGSAE
ncbi:MAG: sel1 repeat family protein [Lentisphaeria bacterium]|nr:sel1 repeat family protein [Lentisphaeria bacterium]